MIKFDKDALRVLQTLEKEKYRTYAAGECVRLGYMGQKTYDWDLITSAPVSRMQELFPEGKLIGSDKQTLRLDFTREVPSGEEDGQTELVGSIVDVKHFDGDVDDELQKNMFRLYAIADNPDRGFMDPFWGRDDVRERMIRTTVEPDGLFMDKPEAMIAAVRVAAETGYDLHRTVFEAMEHWP